jgi:cation transport ATPase
MQTVEALESACDVEVVVFDKTGTLTLGKLAIESAAYYPQQGLQSGLTTERAVQELVRALTASSTHPVSAAVHEHVIAALGGLGVDVCAELEMEVRVVPGKGVEASVGGVLVRGGSAAWAGGEDGGESTVFVVSVAVDEVSGGGLMVIDLILTGECRLNRVSSGLHTLLCPTRFDQTRWRLSECSNNGVSRSIF